MNSYNSPVMQNYGSPTERDKKELYTDGDGRTKLRKNSNLSEIKNLSEIAEKISAIKGHSVLICDSDMYWVEVSRVKTYLGEHITKVLFDIMEKGNSAYFTENEKNLIPLSNEEDMFELIEEFICPIMFNNKAVGAVIIFTKKSEGYDDKCITKDEIDLTEASSIALSSIVTLIP